MPTDPFDKIGSLAVKIMRLEHELRQTRQELNALLKPVVQRNGGPTKQDSAMPVTYFEYDAPPGEMYIPFEYDAPDPPREYPWQE